MTEQEFIDAALIAVARDLSTATELVGYVGSKQPQLLPTEEVAARAGAIVRGLVKVRAAIVAQDERIEKNPHDGCLDCGGSGWSGGVVGSACDVPRLK